MVTGRNLEVEYLHETVEGQKNFIMVDHSNVILLETAYDELSSFDNYRKTLKVRTR